MRKWIGSAAAAALVLGGCQQLNVPPPDRVSVGLNRPAPGLLPAFTWFPVIGASAYQVVVSMDRAGLQPIGVTGFVADTNVSLGAVAWREGHPLRDRPYFWVLRAFDRPDPEGLLLTQSDPREVSFPDGPFNPLGAFGPFWR